MKKFSERVGVVNSSMQINSMDKGLRSFFWNLFYISIFAPQEKPNTYLKIQSICKSTSQSIFGGALFLNADEYTLRRCKGELKKYIHEEDWYNIYELVESILLLGPVKEFEYFNDLDETINKGLRKHNSGYRLIKKMFVPITEDEEVKELENTYYSGTSQIKEHLESALRYLKNEKDYRNSMKESISMVESASKMISPKESTLGKALKKLGKSNEINTLLKEKHVNFYQYTNSEDGIRHALMDDPNVGLDEAKYFLVCCSAFTNYLLSKIS